MEKIKNILKIGCLFVLLIILAFYLFMMYGRSSGEKTVKDFFAVVDKVDIDKFDDHVHSTLQTEADPEFVYMFFQSVLKQCGKFKSINMNGLDFADKLSNGDRFQGYRGVFVFSKKSIPMELGFMNGKLESFRVKDKKISQRAAKYTQKVLGGKLEKRYAEIGKKYFSYALSDKQGEAFDMMHEMFQKQFGKTRFVKLLKNVVRSVGVAKKIKFLSSRPVKTGSTQAYYFYLIDFEKTKKVLCHCTFQFAGFQGHLVGFQTQAKEKP